MSRARPGIRFSLAAAGLLLVLLAVLATLQYRWIGEVSEAEQEKMRASARRAADGVAADFDQEIFHLFERFGLRPQPPGQGSDLGPWFAESAKRWSAESRFPSLLAEIFVARLTGEEDELDRVNLSSGLPERVAWPSELDAVHQWIKTQPHTPLRGAIRGDGVGPRRFFGPQTFDEIPAIAIPDMRGPVKPGGFDREPMAERWVILRLDRRGILTGLLPQLVRQHFGAGGEYDVAVVRRDDPGAVLYRSRAGFPAGPIRSPDAEVLFFIGQAAGANREDRVYRSDERPRQEPFVTFGGPGSRQSIGQEGGAWRLVAVHRAGSLQAAVQSTRRRNLAVSGAILLLLGVVVAALVTSAQRAQRLARQQLEFVAGLTHELRTPLAAIRSAGQNLADGLVSGGDRVRQYGKLLEREGRRLSWLIENALAHAGIEARREGLRTGAVAIPEILEEAIAACRPLAQEQGASLETEIASALPPVAGDPSALRTLFENLISNALKYGGHEGRVRVQAVTAGPSIEMTVRDQGPGISPRDLPRIFEPFYRGSDALSGRVSGSGLGLSLVRRIAEAHGGRVAVESEPGKGTTFRVFLPYSSEPPASLSSAGSAS